MYVRLDCRHFKGDKSCSYNTVCSACLNYQSQGKRILIIKLAASGDVLRTTPILLGLKRKYPLSFITWITQRESLALLKNNNFIDRLLIYDLPDIERLKIQRFDILICLDKEIEAVTLANQVRAKRKFGFGLNPRTGRVIPFNKKSHYAWELGISDELKFHRNKKSYQQIIFEMADLDYRNDEYILNISESDKKYVQNLLDEIGLDRNSTIIGLNTGAGSRFANKAWTEEGFVELIRLIRDNIDTKILLLGGPQEHQRNAHIISSSGQPIYDAGCFNSLGQFAALVNLCSLVVSADTTAMHIAIASKKLVVALFGPTCDQEIELYARGVKIVSPIDCRPCYRVQCEKEINCMKLIKPEDIFAAIQKLFPRCKEDTLSSTKEKL
jgi:heptosyltransferase-2